MIHMHSWDLPLRKGKYIGNYTGVHQVSMKDSGSMTQCIKLSLQGVPIYRIIDSGTDIGG